MNSQGATIPKKSGGRRGNKKKEKSIREEILEKVAGYNYWFTLRYSSPEFRGWVVYLVGVGSRSGWGR